MRGKLHQRVIDRNRVARRRKTPVVNIRSLCQAGWLWECPSKSRFWLAMDLSLAHEVLFAGRAQAMSSHYQFQWVHKASSGIRLHGQLPLTMLLEQALYTVLHQQSHPSKNLLNQDDDAEQACASSCIPSKMLIQFRCGTGMQRSLPYLNSCQKC